MIRVVKFNGRQGFFDLPSFLLSKNEDLTIKFIGLDKTRGKYVLTIARDLLKETFFLSDNMTIDIPNRIIAFSPQKIEFYLELRDETGTNVLIGSAKHRYDATSFYIEPLKVERVSNGWGLTGWLQNIELELQEIKTQLLQVQETLAKYEQKGIPLIFEN